MWNLSTSHAPGEREEKKICFEETAWRYSQLEFFIYEHNNPRKEVKTDSNKGAESTHGVQQERETNFGFRLFCYVWKLQD